MLTILFVACVCVVKYSVAYEVVYAINAGGDAFIDSNNIQYAADLDKERTGIISDYGLQLPIRRISAKDVYLYQTERYHTDSFYYNIPYDGDGDYTLVLKFAEVYFNAVGMKVFHVVLNSAHRIIDHLDIFREVGKGIAHDEIVHFSIANNVLYYANDASRIENDRSNSIRVDFVKTKDDNPKINAIVLFKGMGDDIPKLPSLDDTLMGLVPPMNEATVKTYIVPEQKVRERRVSGPKQPDPYAMDNVGIYLPVAIVIATCIPLMYWMCSL